MGVLLHNKNKLKEMIQTLLGLNNYVPVEHTEHILEVHGTQVTQPITELWPVTPQLVPLDYLQQIMLP